MPSAAPKRVLLTGATGFVGRHLYPALRAAGHEVICATRSARRAARRSPGRRWVALDVDRPSSVVEALHGCDAAIYLVHGMATRGDFEARERAAAKHFADAAARRKLSRVVYLGGAVPAGPPSRHLRSRLATGEILRDGPVPTVELQASMIIGAGSESCMMFRDLSERLPLLALPRWLECRSQPIAIDDVVTALTRALTIPAARCGAFALPGPEALSARQIIERTARLQGNEPITLSVAAVSPRLSSYWIQLFTRASGRVARELVEGLRFDLVSPDDGFWALLPEHQRLSFDQAAKRALEAEARTLSMRSRLAEHLLRKLSRRSSGDGA